MDLKEWTESTSKAERDAFCSSLNISSNYLSQLKWGHKQPRPERAKKMVEVAAQITPDRLLDLPSLRPDIWGSSVVSHAG